MVTVVRVAGSVAPSSRNPIVPTSPVRTPVAASAASSRKVVVVLPLVPVTAYMVIASAGFPKISAAIPATRSRGFWITTTGTETVPASSAPAASVSTARAPPAAAAAANRAPWW